MCPRLSPIFLMKVRPEPDPTRPDFHLCRGPSPRRSAWATQLQRNVAAVASRWRHCADLTGPGIEPQTFRTESVRLATELTAGVLICLCSLKCFLEQSSIIILLVHSLQAFQQWDVPYSRVKGKRQLQKLKREKKKTIHGIRL